MILGIVLIIKKSSYDGSATGIITESKCDGTNYALSIEFKANDGKKYTANAIINKNYKVGQTISLRYNTENPTDITLWPLSMRAVGLILFISSIIILIFAWWWYFIVQNNNTAAAVSGVSNAVGMIDNTWDSQ